MQSIVLEIPLDDYDRFVDQCDPTSRHYFILRNSVLERRRQAGDSERIILIRCTIHEAKGLIDRATDVYPKVVFYIKRSLARSLAAARDF